MSEKNENEARAVAFCGVSGVGPSTEGVRCWFWTRGRFRGAVGTAEVEVSRGLEVEGWVCCVSWT